MSYSVCKFPLGRGDQANHQNKRNHEVSDSRRVASQWAYNSREDDSKWPQKNKDGRQELEIRLGSEHISFEVIRNNCNLVFQY